jgi:CRP-like cAMP-binding protein
VHEAAPVEIQQFFNAQGRYCKLAQGAGIFNGGDSGEIALVLTGIGEFSFSDYQSENHTFTLIFPGSLMGNVDGLTGESVNVIDSAFRELELRLLKKELFVEFLNANPRIDRLHTLSVIADHESDMEGLIANMTLPVHERLRALARSLVWRTGVPAENGWHRLPLALRATEMARIICASRQTASHLLHSLEEQGILKRSRSECLVAEAFVRDTYDWIKEGCDPGVAIRRNRRAAKAGS